MTRPGLNISVLSIWTHLLLLHLLPLLLLPTCCRSIQGNRFRGTIPWRPDWNQLPNRKPVHVVEGTVTLLSEKGDSGDETSLEGSAKRQLLLKQHQQQQLNRTQEVTKHDVVRFGAARVMMNPGDVALGEQLWFCYQIEHVALKVDGCAVDPSTDLPYQKDKVVQRCTFLELGGPGLCALDMGKRLRWVRINMYPSSSHLAEMSRTATKGVGKNLQMGGNLYQFGKNSPAVLLLNFPRTKDILSSGKLLKAVEKLISRGGIRAAIFSLHAHAPADSKVRFTKLLEGALSAGYSAFWGGFDGRDISDNLRQAFPDITYGRQSINVFLLPRTTTATAAAPSRPPPPKLHVLVPLRPQYDKIRKELTDRLCRFLLDTAASRNLSSLHVLGLKANGSNFFHVVKVAQKLLVLRHTLRGLNRGFDPGWVLGRISDKISPSDVVMVIDATDTLIQMPLEEILNRYFEEGAPVLRVSTESGVWPPVVFNYTHLYDEAGDTAVPVPNKYLNSGGIIGRAMVFAKYALDAGELVAAKHISHGSWLPRKALPLASNPRDQGIMSLSYLLGNPYGISLDHQSSFFFSVYCSSHHLVLSCGRLSYNLTSREPAVLHGNGRDGKIRLEALRAAILGGEDYTANPEFLFTVDGNATRHGNLCVGVGQITEFEETSKTAVPCPFEIPGHSYSVRETAPSQCPNSWLPTESMGGHNSSSSLVSSSSGEPQRQDSGGVFGRLRAWAQNLCLWPMTCKHEQDKAIG